MALGMRSRRTVTVQKRAREETTAAVVGGCVVGGASNGALRFLATPQVVYNSIRDGDGRLDSTTPLQLRIRVCSRAAQALLNTRGTTAVELTVAGVDGAPLVHFSAAAGKRVPIKPPTFTAEWDGTDELTLYVDRSTVPLTSAAGDCPLVFAVMVGEDVAVSSSFLCFAKQKPGEADNGEDRPQKRRAKGDEAQVTHRQATLLDRVRTMLGDEPVPAPAPPPVHAPAAVPAAPAPVPAPAAVPAAAPGAPAPSTLLLRLPLAAVPAAAAVGAQQPCATPATRDVPTLFDDPLAALSLEDMLTSVLGESIGVDFPEFFDERLVGVCHDPLDFLQGSPSDSPLC